MGGGSSEFQAPSQPVWWSIDDDDDDNDDDDDDDDDDGDDQYANCEFTRSQFLSKNI